MSDSNDDTGVLGFNDEVEGYQADDSEEIMVCESLELCEKPVALKESDVFDDWEILPSEFLEDPETFSAAFPVDKHGVPGKLKKSRFKTPGSSTRRVVNRVGRSSDSSARSPKRFNIEDYSPEEQEKIRKKDKQAKFIIYSGVALATLVFFALLIYKLPVYFEELHNYWPWTLLNEYVY